MWKQLKKGFDAWEGHTARYLEQAMQSPLLLAPASTALTLALRAKVASDKLTHGVWGVLGLATRSEQERTLHALNELQSQVLDLQERLEQAARSAPGPR